MAWCSGCAGAGPPRGSVAAPGARVGEGPSGSGNELPGIGVRAERELQHAVGVRHGLGVRRDGRGHGGGVPTHTYVELTDPPRGVRVPAGVLGSEALVIVLLTVEHDLRSRGIQIVPDRNDATCAVPRRIIR